jgi:hypothetical protein
MSRRLFSLLESWNKKPDLKTTGQVLFFLFVCARTQNLNYYNRFYYQKVGY